MIMCYFVRCAMFKVSIHFKKISDKISEDRAACLMLRFG